MNHSRLKVREGHDEFNFDKIKEDNFNFLPDLKIKGSVIPETS